MIRRPTLSVSLLLVASLLAGCGGAPKRKKDYPAPVAEERELARKAGLVLTAAELPPAVAVPPEENAALLLPKLAAILKAKPLNSSKELCCFGAASAVAASAVSEPSNAVALGIRLGPSKIVAPPS